MSSKRSRRKRNDNGSRKKVPITSYCGEENEDVFDVATHHESFNAEPAPLLGTSLTPTGCDLLTFSFC